jgi:dTDP-glucose pyrophosphorylase/CBS domain-containing protein
VIGDLDAFCLAPTATLIDVIRCIDRNTRGIALVVDDERRLLYTMTDGDLRRAVLYGLDLKTTIADWARERTEHGNLHPKVASVHASAAVIRDLMKPEGLRHVPLVDDDGRLAGLALSDDLLTDRDAPVTAVVMAGGRGQRLSPLTRETPKPMLPVGDRPLLEHIVDQLKAAGIRRVSVTTHYRPEKIVDHFGDGRRFGLDIDYVNEQQPLGTAGGLGLLPPWESTLLVVNGDILTRVNYQSMLAFHRETGATMSVAVRQYQVPVPYGVVTTDGVQIRSISEKPTIQFFTNAGVYLLDPVVHQHVAARQRLDMPELITRLIAGGERVVSFPVNEYWLDIGQREDYEQAQVDMNDGTR